MIALRAMGIGRDADDERTLFVIFNRPPSDDEMRGVHDILASRAISPAYDEAGERPFAPVDAYGRDAALKDYAAEAAMKCGEPAFKRWLADCHGLERPLTDERVAQKLRSLLGVTSRAELNSDGKAAARWKELRRAFEAWRRAE